MIEISSINSLLSFRACTVLHNICYYSGDDGQWLQLQDQRQRQEQQGELFLEDPRQEEPGPRILDAAAQRRAGNARRQELVRLFRR